SGRFDADLKEVIDEAKIKFVEVSFDESTAVVFDVDETALFNYESIYEMDFGYAKTIWAEWIQEARAPAIKQVKELYDFLLTKGSRIIFITGRKDYEADATIKNLIEEGYTVFDTLITRGESERKLSAVDFKSSKRTELTQRGYTIAGTVGDQWSDLEGAFHGIQVKLPNYLYSVD